MRKLPSALLFLALIALVSSCGSLRRAPTPNPEQKTALRAEFHNPYPAGTYAHFTAEPSYRKTGRVYRNNSLLSQTSTHNASLHINLSTQRAQLMNGKEVAIDYPVSSGKKGYRTPAGSYQVLEKLKTKRSNLYGKIYDAEGTLVKKDADARVDEIPEGGKYVGASMPFWMRLTRSGVGHHVGRVPRYPASHGCIRGPSAVIPAIYSKVAVGTPVLVVD
jgi:lipoprotein-anchoring transpeptidase ErfK/SrfK